MTNRTRELLLELLLIRTRYSDAEFKQVEEELKSFPKTDELRRVLVALDRLGEPEPKQSTRSDVIGPDNLAEMKDRFFKLLRHGQKYRNLGKLAGIARRLGITEIPSEREAMISAIIDRANNLPDAELSRLLQLYRVNKKLDEGYLGLADYLIHSKD